MARTRESPICWATSARTATLSPSTVMVSSRAVLMAGTASGGELDVDDRAGDGDDAAVLGVAPVSVLVSEVTVIRGLLLPMRANG